MDKELNKYVYACRSISSCHAQDWFSSVPNNIFKEKIYLLGEIPVPERVDILVEDWNSQYKKMMIDNISHVKLRIAITSDEHRKHIPEFYIKRFHFLCYKNPMHMSDALTIPCEYLWLPNCAYPNMINNLGKSYSYCNRKYLVSFVGNKTNTKKENINEIIRWCIKNLRDKFYIKCGISYSEMIDIYQDSAIVINESTKKLDLNLRVFEGMVAGALMITNNCKNGIEKLFTDKKDIIIYKNAKDAINLIKHYIEFETKRTIIASAGLDNVINNHCQINRIHKLISYIKEHL